MNLAVPTYRGPRPRGNRRFAFTLIEMVLNLVVLSLIMGTISSAMLIASRAIPSVSSSSATTVTAVGVVEQMAAEIFTATSFTARDARSIEFTVPDRNNDGQPETIFYEWSGTPGDTLKRKYNTSLRVVVAENVQEFDLTYAYRSISETTQTVVTQPGSEILLGTFDNWTGGLVTTLTNNPISLNDWQAEAFNLSPPQDATSVNFTRATLYFGRQGASPTSDQYRVAIHHSAGDGLLADQPATSPLGTPTILTHSALAANYMSKPITFNSDMASTNLTQPRFWLVMKGTGATVAYAQGRSALLAPLDTNLQRWSTNAGTSWEPAVNLLNSRDLRFSVWGFYSTQEVVDETIVKELATGVSITLRLGPAFPPTAEEEIRARRWKTTVQVINEPVVSTM